MPNVTQAEQPAVQLPAAKGRISKAGESLSLQSICLAHVFSPSLQLYAEQWVV